MAGGTPNVKHLWIQDPSGLGDPAVVNESTPEYPGSVGKVGNLKEAAGLRTKVLQYVKRVATDTTIAAVEGNLAYWKDQDDFVVCADQTLAIGGSTVPLPAGVFLGTLPAAGNYGYIQVAGTFALDQGGNNALNVLAGDELFVMAAATDQATSGKVCIPVWTSSGCTTAADIAASVLMLRQSPVGRAIEGEADSTVTVDALLTIAHNGW
jgi:hypothetical protein